MEVRSNPSSGWARIYRERMLQISIISVHEISPLGKSPQACQSHPFQHGPLFEVNFFFLYDGVWLFIT